MTDLNIENLLEELEELLENHNWHYMFATDGETWHTGYNQSTEISDRMEQLRNLGFSKKAEDLYSTKRAQNLGTTY